MKAAIAEGRLKGLARGVAYQIVEQFGVLDRDKVAPQVQALSRAERRALKGLGVYFGAFSLYLPALLTPEAQATASAFAELAAPDWRPAASGLSLLPQPSPPSEALGLRGLRAVAGFAAPVEALERLDALMRAAPQEAGGALLTPQLLAGLGWAAGQAEGVLRGLGFFPARKADSNGASLWRRRRRKTDAAPTAPAAPSPFAALTTLTPSPSARRRARRHRNRRRSVASSAAK